MARAESSHRGRVSRLARAPAAARARVASSATSGSSAAASIAASSIGTMAPDVLSTSSPLGQALIGRGVGESTTYETPKKAQLGVEVVSIRPL